MMPMGNLVGITTGPGKTHGRRQEPPGTHPGPLRPARHVVGPMPTQDARVPPDGQVPEVVQVNGRADTAPVLSPTPSGRPQPGPSTDGVRPLPGGSQRGGTRRAAHLLSRAVDWTRALTCSALASMRARAIVKRHTPGVLAALLAHSDEAGGPADKCGWAYE